MAGWADFSSFQNHPVFVWQRTILSLDTLRDAHPNRLRFAMFGDENFFMRPIKGLAESVRANRQPVHQDNSCGRPNTWPRTGSPPACTPTARCGMP